MSLYIIGLGLGDEKDVTRKGAEAIAASDRVFLEAYTSILGVGAEALSAAFGKPVELAHREMVESDVEVILGPAMAGQTVSFLVVGDPFGATTHTDLLLRAKAAGISTHVVHNASIMNAVGACGLQLYSFGQTVSIPFFRDDWEPDSFYDKIAFNRSGGLHTLCLLGERKREREDCSEGCCSSFSHVHSQVHSATHPPSCVHARSLSLSLCPLPSALCPLPSALCPLPSTRY